MGNPVVDAILGATTDAHVRAAMLMGAQLESGWNPNAVGDNGHSYGPFQIYLVAHPNVSPAQAKDPAWAAAFMLPAYQAGVNKVAPAKWQSNPGMAAAEAAFNAERPKVMYGTDKVNKAWPSVQSALNGQSLGPTTGTGSVIPVQNGTGGSDPFGFNAAADNITTSFRRGVMILANMSLFFAAVTVGSILMLAGLYLIFRATTEGNVGAQAVGAIKAVSPGRLISRGTSRMSSAPTRVASKPAPAKPVFKDETEAQYNKRKRVEEQLARRRQKEHPEE